MNQRKPRLLCSPTFSLHVNDPGRAEPLTADFLLQVKHSPPINLLVGDAVIVVSSPRTGPLNREKSVRGSLGKKGEGLTGSKHMLNKKHLLNLFTKTSLRLVLDTSFYDDDDNNNKNSCVVLVLAMLLISNI